MYNIKVQYYFLYCITERSVNSFIFVFCSIFPKLVISSLKEKHVGGFKAQVLPMTSLGFIFF